MNESIRQFVRAPQRYSGGTLNEGPQVQPEGSGEPSGGDDLKPEWSRGIRREKKWREDGILLCAVTLEVPKSGCMLGVTPVPAFHWDTPSLT